MSGLYLNEDNSHFFFTRSDRPITEDTADAWVDQYAGTQVRALMLNPNAMRTSYDSRVWEPIWEGYDPDGGPEQALFHDVPSEERAWADRFLKVVRGFADAGIDVYARWIARARQHRIAPWLTVRMNDIHSVDRPGHYFHSPLWKDHPEYRRAAYRDEGWEDRALDLSRSEVRGRLFALIEELAGRYDFDGLELDWMRFGFHLRPGHEAADAPLLTEFVRETRRLLDSWAARRGHAIRLGARVPARPESAWGLGMDADGWAHDGLIDLITVTPFFVTSTIDLPIRHWKRLLRGTDAEVAAGLEICLKPSPESEVRYNSLETARGAAAAALERGADAIALFNYMDPPPEEAEPPQDHAALVRELGRLETFVGKSRRHVLTYHDTYPLGEPPQIALPAEAAPGRWLAFRLPTGPRPQAGQTAVARFGLSSETAEGWEVRLNGTICAPLGLQPVPSPAPSDRLFTYQIPAHSLFPGDNLLEIKPASAGRILWVEIAYFQEADHAGCA